MYRLAYGLPPRQRARTTTLSQARSARDRLGAVTNAEAVRIVTERGWLQWAPAGPAKRDDAGFPLTPAMRAYLQAFDELLLDRLPGARDRMKVALARMYADAGREPPKSERCHDTVLASE